MSEEKHNEIVVFTGTASIFLPRIDQYVTQTDPFLGMSVVTITLGMWNEHSRPDRKIQLHDARAETIKARNSDNLPLWRGLLEALNKNPAWVQISETPEGVNIRLTDTTDDPKYLVAQTWLTQSLVWTPRLFNPVHAEWMTVTMRDLQKTSCLVSVTSEDRPIRYHAQEIEGKKSWRLSLSKKWAWIPQNK